MLTDTHCHLYYQDLRNDIPVVLNRAAKLGVNRFICVGTNIQDSRKCLELANAHEKIYATAGVHPHDAKDTSKDYLDQICDLLKSDKMIAAGQISGGFTFQSATDLALLLRSGALPAPLNIIEERTVGPDLGQDSIDSGIFALIIGFILVIIFMLIKYKIFGIIANITLILNLFLLVGILTLFEATLTLPGIAGIILTVGMAVDANVLIFERIKEEIKFEKNQIVAFDSGYIRSKSAIIDANITTLIAAIILFFLGSGPIKGFSVTLGVGIFTTLFSVYFIARLLTSIYVVKNKNKENLI